MQLQLKQQSLEVPLISKMATFGVKLKIDQKARDFFLSSRDRLQENNMVKNPFTGNIVLFEDLAVVHMKPVYLNFPKYVLLTTIFLMLGFGFRKWMIPFFVISLFIVFWSTFFYYPVLYKGLRKVGYNGKISLVWPRKIIEEVFFNGDVRSSEFLRDKTTRN